MRLSQEHDSNYLRLGLILVFSGFLFAFFFVTRVNARELSPQIFDTEAVLVYDNDPLSVYGCDHSLYFYQDPLNDEILLSSSFNPEIEQLYDHWYGSRVMDSVRSWGFNYLSYDILKGHIINLMSRTNTFWISRYDTISNVELKELVLDDSYEAFYFMDSNFNYYCYVSYIPVNSETVQPEYPFDSFTINDSGHFVEQDPLYRELFVWDLSNQRWVYSSVSSSDVVVHTVLRSPSGVRLESGAQVYVQSSRFLIDDPLPTATPSASPTPLPDPESYNILLQSKKASGYYNHYSFLISFEASGILDFYNQPLNSTVESVLLESDTSSTLLKYNAQIIKSGKFAGSWLGNYYGDCFLFYVKCSSYSNLHLYRNDGPFASTDFDYIKNNYSTITFNVGGSSYDSEGYNCFYYVDQVDDGYIICFVCRTGEYNGVPNFDVSSDIWFQQYSFSSSSNVNYSIPFSSGSLQYKEALKLMLDVENNAVPDPNVTPTPEPSPTPTDAPHVIVVWPTGTPTPTPPIIIPTSPLIPPGDGITPLDPELQEDVFGVFKSKIGDNNSFGLFGLLIGLLPGDLMWYIWFLLFVLLVVGVAKLFIHFTGG